MANEWDVVRREPIAASRAVAPANTQADPWAVVSQQGGEIHDLPAITATTSDVGQEILANFADIMGGAQPPPPTPVARISVPQHFRAPIETAAMRDRRRAATMAGFAANIGKYVSLAYLEAEKEAF